VNHRALAEIGIDLHGRCPDDPMSAPSLGHPPSLRNDDFVPSTSMAGGRSSQATQS
jgi:hypothetical protein